MALSRLLDTTPLAATYFDTSGDGLCSARYVSGFLGTAVASDGVIICLCQGRRADCPSTFISKHLAVSFQSLQRCFGSLGDVIDSLGDLIRRHLMAAKRQFTQDHFAYGPTHSPSHRLFAVGIFLDIAGSNFVAQHLDGRSKSFLPGFDQLGFLGFLFAERERRLSVSFEPIQVRAGFLK
jgi:hypothetical protein